MTIASVRFVTALIAFLSLAALAFVTSPLFAAENSAGSDASAEFFEKQVRPLLANSCYSCHSAAAKEIKGGLRLDSREQLLTGGDSGPAIVPGQPAKSRLVEAVGYQDPDLQMPPKKRLPADKVAVLARWVELGAPWPDTPAAITEGGHSAASASPKKKFDLAARRAAHWAWQPIHAVAPPAVKHPAWANDPIDNFLLARWETAGMRPPPTADRRALIRRASFDLVGLPPTADDVEAFIGDRSPKAWETVVDRLLASPQFGERWARHWLDLARYAETRGHEFDYAIPDAWQYRDYVIRAFNSDVPYSQFVAEQIAGDLLPAPRFDPSGRINESVLGTGFWHLGEWLHSPVDIRQDEFDRVDNQIDVMGKTFLGLTLGCARCHDHKFDAISSKDYYAVAGMLESSSFRDVRFEWERKNRTTVERLEAIDDTARTKIVRTVVDGVRPTIGRFGDYLLAARSVLRTGRGLAHLAMPGEQNATVPLPLAPRAASDAGGEAVAAIADHRHLDPVRLARIVDMVQKAHTDAFDPLYPWAVLSLDSQPESLERIAQLLRPIAADWRAASARAATLPLGAAWIVDYGHAAPADWITDGMAFGDRPAHAGEIFLALDAIGQSIAGGGGLKLPGRSLVAVVPEGMANSGLISTALHGMLRTPEFKIASPQLWYRICGSGDVFVVVDSHRMVAGPLHGSTKRHVDAGERWTWISHNVSDYVGQHAHIEFTPTGKSGFIGVAGVIQSPSAPPEPSRADRLLSAEMANILSSLNAAPSNAAPSAHDAAPSSAAIERLAERYQSLVTAVADDLAANRLAEKPDAPDRALLANWLLGHADALAFRQAGKPDLRESQLAEHHRERKAAVAELKPSATAMAMLDGNGFDEHVLLRGSHKTPGEIAPRRFLEAIAGPHQPPIEHGSGRLELAERMIDPSDPFVPRVMVNRVWQHLFGRGIVPTADNFGVLGQRPTHPELLDFLADRFIREGWSVKRLIREIMLSSSYQMSAAESAADRQSDPQNLLWHHALVRRLEGEAIRDAMLAVSGRLDLRMGGPSEEVHLTAFMEGRGRPGSGPLDGDGRRSIYIKVRRNFLSPMMTAFDMPEPFNTVGNRGTSNLPAQALIMLNDPLVVEQSHVWARRVLAGQGLSPRERIRRMYLAAFARPPSDAELADDLAFLDSQAESLGIKPADRPTAEQPWADLCHVLFNVKEFIFID
ncbi:MAG TPA: PSD1 and planctomycete cytochrome C domain-containing protein [Pirellulales bacterium]|nr:PSD1 and planctomycete cytochrome C domain-containing protein [Pirellulales bacterium]